MRKYLIAAALTIIAVFLFSEPSFGDEHTHTVSINSGLADRVCFYDGKAYSHGSYRKLKHKEMWCFSKGYDGKPEWRNVSTENWTKVPKGK